MGPTVRSPSKVDGGKSYLDRILDSIHHPRRRLLLYYLTEAEEVNIEEGAKHVAAQEQDVDPSDVPDEVRDRVLTSLYHGHVPRLKTLGIIDYDRRSGDLRLQDAPKELEEFLELTRSLDEGVYF